METRNMYKIVTFLILVFSNGFINGCPVNWVPSSDGSLCYFIEESLKIPREDAANFCASKEAVLTIIPLGEMYHLCNSISQSDFFWIGARSLPPPSPVEYVWDDGQPLTWDNWREGDPDTSKLCITLDSGQTNCTWESKDCGVNYKPICQRPATTVDLCPPGWLAYTSSCVKMEWSTKIFYSDAEDMCSVQNGTLFSLPVQDKVPFVLSMIAIYNTGPYWIGYNVANGTWSSGEPMAQLDYTIAWDSGYPVMGECAMYSQDNTWRTDGCDKDKAYICEQGKDECRSSPCLNGGICSNLIGGFTCTCTIGYTGSLCETAITTTGPTTTSPVITQQYTARQQTAEQTTQPDTTANTLLIWTTNSETTTSPKSWSTEKCSEILDQSYFLNCWNEELANLFTEYTQSDRNPLVLHQTLSRLQEVTEAGLSYPKDVEVAMELLNDMLVHNPLSDDGLTISGRNTFIENSVKTANNMLNVDYKEQWSLLNQFVDDKDPIEVTKAMDTFSDDIIGYMLNNDIETIARHENFLTMEYRVLDPASSPTVAPVTDLTGDTQITLPSSIYSGYIGSHDKIGIEHAIYKSISNLSKSKYRNRTVGTGLLSLEIHPAPSSPFQENIEISFNHDKAGNNSICAFLDVGENSEGVWSSEGCEVIETSFEKTVCSCNHLTSFAVLMQIVDFDIPEAHKKALGIITFIGCGISLVSLFATFVILAYFRLNSERITILQNMVIALMMAQFTFITGITATENRKVCRFVAILLHYLYLAAFFWMMVQGIQLYIKIKNVFNHSAKVVQFMILGWGVPIIIVGMSAGLKWQYYGNDDYCWLTLKDGLPAAFIIPAMAVVVLNFCIIAVVMKAFLKVRINAKKSDVEKMKAGIRAGLVLVPLLGLTWVFGILAVNEETLFFQYIFTITNSLQGFFVFIFHCYLNDEVKTAFNKKFRRASVSCDSKGSSAKTVSEAWSDKGQGQVKTKPYVTDEVKSLSSLRKVMTCEK